jgi:hypothetical protein
MVESEHSTTLSGEVRSTTSDDHRWMRLSWGITALGRVVAEDAIGVLG